MCFLEKQYRFIHLPLRPLRLCEKTGCNTSSIGWFFAYTKIDNNCQIKPELPQLNKWFFFAAFAPWRPLRYKEILAAAFVQ